MKSSRQDVMSKNKKRKAQPSNPRHDQVREVRSPRLPHREKAQINPSIARLVAPLQELMRLVDGREIALHFHPSSLVFPRGHASVYIRGNGPESAHISLVSGSGATMPQALRNVILRWQIVTRTTKETGRIVRANLRRNGDFLRVADRPEMKLSTTAP